jgi:hypothetical protein
MRALVVPLLAMALSACQGAPPAEVKTSMGSLVLGTGDVSAFVPYVDGQDVTLVEGAQGGFHVWMRYAFDGVPGAEVKLERRAHRVVDDELVLRSNTQVVLELECMPMPMFMCPAPVGLSVIDQPIDFELRISDDSGVLADQHVTLVAHCPTENADFCFRICKG